MTENQLMARFRSRIRDWIPLPGHGQTALRLERMVEVARENLSLARLTEAHWDAISILAEAGREASPGALYGVWASEAPNSPICLNTSGVFMTLMGSKAFCTGAGIVDRALVTVKLPQPLLVDLDLRLNLENIEFDHSRWQTEAFAKTQTATARFNDCIVNSNELVGSPDWYLNRIGFWHGALAPAACWAGGAMGLIDYALMQSRHDPHTLAHVGAMQSSAWALRCYLKAAGDEIDSSPNDGVRAKTRALTVRHLVEQTCGEVLQRFGRAYGPYPLAMNLDIARRCQELTLYLRQCHAERDLETLGKELVEALEDQAVRSA